MFEESEIAVLLDYAGDMGFQLPCQKTPDTLPEITDVSLGEAVLLIARLGGYLNRKNEAPLGHQVVWNGYFRLSMGAQTLERSIRQGDLSAQKELLISKKMANGQGAGSNNKQTPEGQQKGGRHQVQEFILWDDFGERAPSKSPTN